MASPDLSFVDTGALLDELSERYDYVVFAGERDLNGKQTSFHCDYRGPVSAALGMLERCRHKWLKGDE